MDNTLIELLYKYALVPLCAIFWWLFKKIDYRLERSELANQTIQKEFELRMQTIEKALEIRISMLEKANVSVLVRLDNIKEIVGEIKENQQKAFDKLTKR